MAERSRDGNRREHVKHDNKPNDIMRQLFSRIGKLSDSISRTNQVDTESEVRQSVDGSGNFKIKSKQENVANLSF